MIINQVLGKVMLEASPALLLPVPAASAGTRCPCPGHGPVPPSAAPPPRSKGLRPGHHHRGAGGCRAWAGTPGMPGGAVLGSSGGLKVPGATMVPGTRTPAPGPAATEGSGRARRGMGAPRG